MHTKHVCCTSETFDLSSGCTLYWSSLFIKCTKWNWFVSEIVMTLLFNNSILVYCGFWFKYCNIGFKFHNMGQLKYRYASMTLTSVRLNISWRRISTRRYVFKCNHSAWNGIGYSQRLFIYKPVILNWLRSSHSWMELCLW